VLCPCVRLSGYQAPGGAQAVRVAQSRTRTSKTWQLLQGVCCVMDFAGRIGAGRMAVRQEWFDERESKREEMELELENHREEPMNHSQAALDRTCV
jgi:hypothetical protein